MKNPISSVPLAPDLQNRLLAYTTAASLGAFFAGHNAEAQITLSPAFAPYPATILPPPNGGGVATNGVNGFYGFYHYFSVDGGATNQFFLTINNPISNTPTNRFGNQFVDLFGQSGKGTALTPTPVDPYLVPFLGGTTINSTNSAAPSYVPRLAISYLVPSPYGGYYNYLDNKYITTGALGFKFVGNTDGQTHFGYMDVVVNTTTNTGGYTIVKSVVIQDMYYNATANAAITVPIQIKVTSFKLGAANAVTIKFTSNDNAAASSFSLQSSPKLGAGAVWTTDTSASISLVSGANLQAGLNLASYQITTTATGGAAQYYRIVESH